MQKGCSFRVARCILWYMADTVPEGRQFTDGRVARRERTRQRVVDAHTELLREGVLRPTAAHIAERAGVSVRTLWTVFGDMEALFGATTDFWFASDDALSRRTDLEADLPHRIAGFCDERVRRLENISPAARAAVLLEPVSPALRASRRRHAQRVVEHVEEVFAPELRAAGAEREELRWSLVAAASWNVWSLLRDDFGHSLEEASVVMRRTLTALLDP
ncbi:hypothetical protein HMPREF0063_10392 [Aeromicrobium marinum DSM 15272]|uniref:HTH tetR-type domain-containing protein n=2 Tax=Aeromicrobium marinum TaxID=219314 RepID=E2S8N5_9ACTN|nr:hypothetical protein HMPREF0063_10392 [Aeromicrobium marinum DSM 15272]